MNSNTAPIQRMEHIEALTGTFAIERDRLSEQLQALRYEQESVKRRRLHFIRAALKRFTAAHDALKTAVSESADIFQSPKTRMLHGVKVGFMKQRGKLEIDNADQVVKLIRKLYPKQFDALVKTTYTPVRPALQNMQVVDMKRLGVRVTDDVDAVVIKAADSELDKLIDALLNDPELEEVR